MLLEYQLQFILFTSLNIIFLRLIKRMNVP